VWISLRSSTLQIAELQGVGAEGKLVGWYGDGEPIKAVERDEGGMQRDFARPQRPRQAHHAMAEFITRIDLARNDDSVGRQSRLPRKAHCPEANESGSIHEQSTRFSVLLSNK
jgi:hypothetical protein